MEERDRKPSHEDQTLDGASSATSASFATRVATDNLEAILEIGSVLGGRYEILEMLGLGGMGAVYKARDTELDRVIALKVIRPDIARHPEALARFRQELLTARQVSHRNVVRIFDIGDADGVKFITMEYVAGRDLRSVLTDQGKLPISETLAIVRQICSALGAAHAEGVIHRDLKPGNIMQDEQGKIVVMDFGLARSLEDTAKMTQTGAMLGTVEYMSPEQAMASKLDARSDLFTIGLIFYELLTGNTPYRADSALASLVKRTQERAIPAVEVDPTIPKPVSDIVAKCLEREPEQRFQSAEEIIERIDEVEGRRPSSMMAAPSPIAVPVPPIKPKSILALALSAAVVFALALGVTFFLKSRSAVPKQAQKRPVTALVADFTNNTGDPIFDGTLEPMFNVALEGASFVSAYNRGSARKLAEKLPHPSSKLDEQSARLVAISQGISAVVTGELSLRGNKYVISSKALDAVTGNVLAQTEVSAPTKDDLLLAIPKLAAPVRTALGDTTPESVQVEKAGGAFTAASLEVVHQYAVAMDSLFAGGLEPALASFSKAVALDPNFARAYAGMAAASGNLGKAQDADKYVKLAMEHVDRLTDRERYRVRGFYYYTTGNWQKCVEEYGELVNLYPADNVGQANLAGCYIHLRNAPKAIEAARRAVEVVPQGALQRVVLSFYSSYGGDFSGAEQEARKALAINPSTYAYLALAESQLGQAQMSQATETYQTMGKLNTGSASLAASGLADVANYDGRFAEAIRILEQGAAADMSAKNPEGASAKHAALAQTQLARGQNGPAVAAASKALTLSQEVPIRFLAARTFIEAGDTAKAQKLITSLASELQVEPQTYAKILQGELLLKRGDKNEAIKLLTEANGQLDTWIGRYALGRAYLEAGLFVEADSEFDRCIKRRGEAIELFMDNVPTIGYFPMVYYYQGRVREGLKSPGFADSYRTYLGLRGKAGEDPLLADIHKRLGQ